MTRNQTTIMAEQALNGLSLQNQEKPVILIADDSRVVRVSLKNILKNDCQLIEAEDGLQAWELLLEHPHIQLIFSDLSMPRLDGRGLLQKIRHSEINRIRNLPFIVVTGNEEDAGIRQELQDRGATEMVRKPFDPASIVSFVSTLVAKQDDESYFILGEEQNQTEFLPGVTSQIQFMETAGKELSFAIRNKNELAIALLKVDQFDSISSHYSDPAVEHILLTAAEIIRQHIHPDDTMAYFGDGLYAILRPASNAIGTRYIGRRIIEDLTAKQFYLGEANEAVSASVGISAPEIKHGTRLRELLLLAEGRLKAAMDLGGNRVIDKGNDTLTPISTIADSSQELITHSGISTQTTKDSYSQSGQTNVQPGGHSNHETNWSGQETGELLEHVAELNNRLEQLADENKELHAQVDRWRKQSAESEQLRRRVFELESEQQQMQLKLTDLQADTAQFKHRAEAAEQEREQFIESEEERTATLKQANQFYEEENLRLEGQLDALSNRAQKAELASRKSEQLIVSLKDNIALLRAQLEQVQAQLSATRQPLPPEPLSQDQKTEVEQAAQVAVDSQSVEPSESNLLFDGFPSSETVVRQKAPVFKMFPDKATVPSPPESKPVKTIEQAPPKPSIPVYRLEDERPPLPREPRPLSSFAIASLILFLLLAVGGGYLYSYMQQTDIAAVAVKQTMEGSTGGAEIGQVDAQSGQTRAPKERGGNDHPSSKPTTGQAGATQVPPSSIPSHGLSELSEEAKLEAEQTLRQIAEEEFNQQLHQINAGERTLAPPMQETQEQVEESLPPVISADGSVGNAVAEPTQTEAPPSSGTLDTVIKEEPASTTAQETATPEI